MMEIVGASIINILSGFLCFLMFIIPGIQLSVCALTILIELLSLILLIITIKFYYS